MKYLVWDVDGTLYPSTPKGKDLVKKIYEKKIIEVYGKIPENLQEWFSLKKKEYKSSTLTFLTLAIGPLKKVAEYFDKTFAEKIPIKKDPKLIELFERLKNYEHYALRNGTYKGTIKILKRLELDKIKWKDCEFGPFKKVWATLDTMGVPKPHPAVFEYVRTYLFFKEKGRFPKNENEAKKFAKKITVIGDREKVDLEPARRLGMKGILVKNSLASLPKILQNKGC